MDFQTNKSNVSKTDTRIATTIILFNIVAQTVFLELLTVIVESRN